MHETCVDENLIGYLLGALDDETSAQVASQLETDAEARRRLDELRLALEPLALDSEAEQPPADLALRTLARVAEHSCLDLTKAPVILARPLPPRSWWRRADFVVAASLLLLALGLVMPALYQQRAGAAAMAQCADNMRTFNTALHAYRENYGKFPSVKEQNPRDAAGMVVPILTSAGVLPEGCNLRCPGSDAEPAVCPLTLEQAHAFPWNEFLRQAEMLNPSYAYSLGYWDENDVYRGPAVPESMLASDFPLMADAPPNDGGLGNSNNHRRAGQWILFADGHAQFLTVRGIGAVKDDIYRNKANQVAAGLDCADACLGPSAAKP